MDYETIEDEVYEFCEIYFDEIAEVAENNVNFIEDNRLHIPKENYAILNKFLQKVLKNFKILDQNYCSSTLDKLGYDLEQLNELYDNVVKKSKNTLDIFESKFTPRSHILTNFTKALLNTSELSNKTQEDIDSIKKMKKDYPKLKEVFYSIFEEVFNEDKKQNLVNLKNSINSKTYYFDKLLWKEADKSATIVKHFSIRKLDGKLNTKDYILFTTAIMRPYTDEYRYLQNCLKVFK